MADFLHTKKKDRDVKETILISKCNHTKLAMDTIHKEIKCRPLSGLDGVPDTTIFDNLKGPIQETIGNMEKKEDRLKQIFRNAELNYIASGSYNAVYSIETYEDIRIGNPFVLRMTKPSIRQKKYIYEGVEQETPYPNPREYKELIGLRYQALFSKSKSDGGFGCPHIGKVYDCGQYSDLDLFKSKMSEDERKNFNDDKQLILEDIPEYSAGSFSPPYEEGTYGIIEKTNGGTLADRMDYSEIYATNPVFIKYIIFYLLQTADCLHKNRLVHLDIKPENIMLVYDGGANMLDVVKHTTIKLVDFGLCGKVNETIDHVVGTPLFTSQYFVDDIYLNKDNKYEDHPIAGRTHTIDYKDDIWSIGVVLCELTLNAGSLNALEFLDFTPINNRKYSIRPNDTFKDALRKQNPKLHDFLQCIFRKYMDPDDEELVSTAEELLNHAWLAAAPQNNAGGRKKKKKYQT